MKRIVIAILVFTILCGMGCKSTDQSAKDTRQAKEQQSQYAKSQPVPSYNWSLERHIVIELYNTRNMKAATHSVWRSDYGLIEGDCSSIGFAIPYDTSLTNPLVPTDLNQNGVMQGSGALTSIEQAEPNGIYASKNTSASWVMCAGSNGAMDPVYVESKVTVYPYPVKVVYETNRVTKAGKSTVSIKTK
ncbi:MAG: hypothetical protein QM489_00415 [Candidatus Izemoplasma sp.]